jgi:hypothetical protein
MYSNNQVDRTVEGIISTTATGKNSNGRNKAISAYGVCARLPKAMADYFINLGGVGGKHGKTVPGVPALTQVVQHSLKRLMAAGKARHFYEDTTAMSFDIHGHHVVPSYPVMAVYQYVPPTASTTATPTP